MPHNIKGLVILVLFAVLVWWAYGKFVKPRV